MTEHEFLAALEPWFERHRRPAWKPVTRDGDAGPLASKFGGVPWLAPGEGWPACGHCDRPMPLFLQLNLATLPEELGTPFGEGLVQLFYCTNDDPHCESEQESWMPFGPAKLARVARPGGDAPGGPAAPPGSVPEIPPRSILLWQRFDDYPDFEDFGELGVRTRYITARPPRLKAECPELSLAFEGKAEKLSESLDRCREGDKLAGWPDWLQGAEWPDCPECGARLQLVFQIDAEDHLDYAFGDLGRAHLMQCPAHPHILGFGWACG